ncbi:MarR family winged helix-turn-helix transcriptional regulator [Streptomyces lydicus]|uniref:MarR family winged helix-turn-helix transcriptional regulator n=1 Tax=Streptomyces lydicus TaxID=47763 RepID=UPI0037A64083
MDHNLPASESETHDAATAASELIELLEVLWDQGRDAVPTAPVSLSQLRVLYAVERDEGINLRTLSRLLDAAPSSVSRLCDRLQAIGYLKRAPHPSSGRELELRLTGQGVAYLVGLRARREEALRSFIARMPRGERAALTEGLTGFRTVVDAASPIGLQASRDVGARSARSARSA